LSLLRPLKLPEFAKTLRGLLDDPASSHRRDSGTRAFANGRHAAASSGVSESRRRKLDAVQTLAARKEWANALLDAVEQKHFACDIP